MGQTGQSLPVLFILRLPADVWSFPFSGYRGTWVEPTRNPQLKSLPACPKHGHKYNCCLPEPPIFYFSHVDVNIRSCHTAVTNLMAALQEGEPMLLTFGAAAAWSSWSTPVPSCLQGTRTAGDPPAWTNTEQPECPVLPAGASLLSSATTGKKKN